MIVKLTQDFINNQLVCPAGASRVEYVSDDRTGLYIEVRKSSSNYGTFYLRYKNANNVTAHQKLGKSVDITLAEAKELARTFRAEIALGKDPRAEAKAKLAVLTLNQFFFEHYLPFAKQNKRSWLRDQQIYVRIDKAFGTRRLNDVSRLELQKFHGNLLNEGLAPATANHHLKLAKRLWNLAIAWELASTNPVQKIRLFREENQVENLLAEDDLNRLLAVLRSDKPRVVCQLLIFLLSTGARFNEAAQSTWSQIDLENRVWRIPATNSKSKKTRAVPLNDSALAVISELNTKGQFDYLFVNAKTKRPYTTIARSWTQLKKKAKIEGDLRIHDLRHNFASFLVNSGVSLYVCQQLLGHSTPTVTQRYAHLNVSSLQKASDVASKKILSSSEAKAA